MSIIEQAAKRLEELRSAGADITEGEAGAANLAEEAPTPEKLVRALDARLMQHGPAPAPSIHITPSPIGRTTTRYAEINLSHLAGRGFVTPNMPTSQLADEFRVVKRPIIHNSLGKDGTRIRNRNLIMVTSALPGEGKTFTAVNLAMSVAMEYNNTVLLIDGDVAHPSLPIVLGVPSEPGLLDLLTRDDLDVADAMVRTNVDKL